MNELSIMASLLYMISPVAFKHGIGPWMEDRRKWKKQSQLLILKLQQSFDFNSEYGYDQCPVIFTNRCTLEDYINNLSNSIPFVRRYCIYPKKKIVILEYIVKELRGAYRHICFMESDYDFIIENEGCKYYHLQKVSRNIIKGV